MSPQSLNEKDFVSWNEEMVQKYDPEEFHAHPNPLIRLIEGRRVRVLLKLLAAQKDSTVLDVGCGAGNILVQVHSKGRYGIDISEHILRRARQRLGEEALLFKGNAEELPFADGVFNRVYCSEVIEHVLHPQTVLGEMHRVLAPGGKAIVSVPNEPLINALKKVLFPLGIIKDHICRSENRGYKLAKRMDDEWHLHVFNKRRLKQVASPLFRLEKVVAIPSKALPLRYVASLIPR